MEVYFYLALDEVENVVECGLKLSKWSDRQVCIGGEDKKCIIALINPKDDMDKYDSSSYKCLKLDLNSKYCYAADSTLYNMGLKDENIMKMYLDSIMPLEGYIFGKYRKPECLITSTVIAEQISVLDKRRDSPVLFDNSEELYINNIIESHKENNESFTDDMLYYFYSKLAEMKKLDKIIDLDSKMALFVDIEGKKNYTVRIPDIFDYVGNI